MSILDQEIARMMQESSDDDQTQGSTDQVSGDSGSTPEDQVSENLDNQNEDDTQTGNIDDTNENEGQEPSTEPEQKPDFSEILKDVSPEFLKDFGEVRDEIDAKRAKEQYHATKTMHEKAAALAKIEKDNKEIQLQKQKQELDKNELSLRQEYISKIEEEKKAKNNELANFRQNRTQELINFGYSAEQANEIVSNELINYTAFTDDVFLKRKNEIDTEYSGKLSSYQQNKAKYENEIKEKSFNQVEEKFKTEFEKEPELKGLFDEFKNNFHYADEFETFVIPQFKKLIADRDARMAKVNGINAAIQNHSKQQKAPQGSSIQQPETSKTSGHFSDEQVNDFIRIT